MSKFKVALVFIALSVINSCSDGQDEEINPRPIVNVNPSPGNGLTNTDFNILFIGNSLTYYNNLPQLVIDAAKLKGVSVGTKMIAHGNYALIDHWADGEVQQEIATKKFNFVVVQQGPSSQPWGREVLIEYGQKLKEICDQNDAELCFFMVWPARSYYHTFDGVIRNYTDAAVANNAILCPVGSIWKNHFDSTGNFDYYGPDGFHPSLIGSQVAAEVIVEALFP